MEVYSGVISKYRFYSSLVYANQLLHTKKQFSADFLLVV